MSLLAVAVAAAMPFAAQAQVTLFGVFDIGVQNQDSAGTKTTKLAAGQAGTPRLGVRGSNDLGNGLKAVFHFETGVDMISGAGFTQFGNRGAFGGLAGSFGQVVAGASILSPSFYATAALDPAGADSFGIANYLYGGEGRNDAAISFTSNSISGLTIRAAYSVKDNAAAKQFDPTKSGVTDAIAGGSYDLSAVYAAGPLTIAASYADNDAGADGMMVGGVYDLKMAKVHVRYVDTTIKAGSTSPGASKGTALGLTVPFGSLSVLFDYLSSDLGSGDVWSLTGKYTINKSTYAFVYAKSDDTRLITTGGKLTQQGVGIRHNF